MVSEKKKKIWYYILYALGLLACVVPPVLATLEHFPVWMATGGTRIIVPASAVILLIISAIPLVKYLRKKIKTPAVWMVWIFLWFILRLLRPVIDGMISVAGIGAISNVSGALLMFAARKFFGNKHEDREAAK